MHYLRVVIVFIIFLNVSINCSIFSQDEKIKSDESASEISPLEVAQPAKAQFSERILLSEDMERFRLCSRLYGVFLWQS